MIADYLHQTATLKAQSGSFNDDGTPVTTSSSISCRWQFAKRLTRDENGDEVASIAQIFTDSTVTVGDRIVSPDGDEYRVLEVLKHPFLDGTTSHFEVKLGGVGI